MSNGKKEHTLKWKSSVLLWWRHRGWSLELLKWLEIEGEHSSKADTTEREVQNYVQLVKYQLMPKLCMCKVIWKNQKKVTAGRIKTWAEISATKWYRTIWSSPPTNWRGLVNILEFPMRSQKNHALRGRIWNYILALRRKPKFLRVLINLKSDQVNFPVF